ncbi:MAG: lipase maturation factor family protein [Phycisphaerae bacterium]
MSRKIGGVGDPAGESKPVLVYDGQCEFCRRWVERGRRTMGDRIEYIAYQDGAHRFPEITYEAFASAVHLVETDGRAYRGAEAIFRALARGGGKRWPLWGYRHLPGVGAVTELVYRFVAGHRRMFSFVTRMLWGPDPGPASYQLTRWLFVRLVGAVYLIAFASLAVQILGLVGSHGILPACEHIEYVKSRVGEDGFWRFPTLAWWWCSDWLLQWSCWVGAGLSLLVILRIAPAPVLAVLWVLYLSLYRCGQVFLSFQWDILLLETGLLAVFFASWHLWPRLKKERAPPRVALWLIWWLLFRLMFFSGAVKLLDDSPTTPTWHDWTALTYHYQTTCIPNALSWYAHHLPLWFHKFSVVTMFVIELGVPFLILAPRRLRIAAFFPLVLLQLLIILTGNYNFFNLLTIALCVTLLDDAFLRRFFPRRMRCAVVAPHALRKPPLVQRLATVVLAVVVIIVSGVWTRHTLRGDRSQRRLDTSDLPQFAQSIVTHALPFSSINTYGLFRQMTTRRPEIIIEGSDDGRTWLAYEFKWKPGDLKRRPAQVAPHQPRLDWQMWFAALSSARRTPWFVRFVKRLLEGSPEVLALMEFNPFPDKPPRYIRAVLYDYHYTDWKTRRKEGSWWTRERLGLYLQPLSLQSFQRRR